MTAGPLGPAVIWTYARSIDERREVHDDQSEMPRRKGCRSDDATRWRPGDANIVNDDGAMVMSLPSILRTSWPKRSY